MATSPVPALNTDVYTPDRLLAAGTPISEVITILTGNNILRGDLMGKITASGKYIKSLSAAVDGSQTPVAIAAQDIDATGGDKLGALYFAGRFNGDTVNFGASHTRASTFEALQKIGIFLHVPVSV